MTGPVFVDANVIVYSRDTRDAEKQRRAEAWLRHLWERGEGRLSAQVLHEYYVTVTRKLRPGMPAAEARSDVRALLAWLVSVPEAQLLEGAWHEQDSAGLSWWDACWSPPPRRAGAGRCSPRTCRMARTSRVCWS